MNADNFKEPEKEILVEPVFVEPEQPVAAIDNSASEVSQSVETPDGFPDLGERYKVLEFIGKGGMGSVYKVRDLALEKEFAVKVLNNQLVQDKISVKRFEQEAEAASGLTHANLAAVYGFGVARSGSPFLVMDYLEGETLEQILKREGFLDVSRALDVFIQATEAIVNAHMKGVIHRDIKPSNLIIEKRDNNIEHAKLLDFGIAKILPSEKKAHENLTQTGDIFGSPLYMSPEQCQGNMQDRRSDIYSLGCLMYEALTGVQAYAADNPIKIILRHISEDAQPISKLKHEYNIPKDLEDVVMRCLERLPEDRYQSADELLRDLRKVRDGAKVKLAPLRKKKTETTRRLSLAKFTLMSFAVVTALAALALVCGIYSGLDPFNDAQSFDSKSYGYFVSGQYEKAAPLLEFGISTYKERLEQDRAKGDTDAARRDETLLAENYQHIGKCHLKMAEKAATNGDAVKAAQEYEKAKNAYKEAMPFYYRYGNWPGGSTPEAVRDYAAVLRALNDSKELQTLSEFARRFNLSM